VINPRLLLLCRHAGLIIRLFFRALRLLSFSVPVVARLRFGEMEDAASSTDHTSVLNAALRDRRDIWGTRRSLFAFSE